MPFRLGELFLFGVCVLATYFCLVDRSRPRDSQLVGVADQRAPAFNGAQSSSVKPTERGDQLSRETPSAQATGRKANVGGINSTFECVEYRFDNILEVHVRQIDQSGQPLSPPSIHLEPFEEVIATYTNVASF